MNNNSSYQEIVLQNIFTTDGVLINQMIINDGQIKSINLNEFQLLNKEKNICFHFDNAIVFPGLINSHDHLDFNLFPQLGNRIYKNYVEWGNDIHLQNREIINDVLKIPKELRTQWGVYKNLLNGITTVFNHGEQLQVHHALIDIFQDKNSLHSVQLEKHWKQKLNNPFNKKDPYVIHVGEGTDEKSYKEIDTLISWNLMHKKLIGIHAVAMNVKQAASLEGLVWCPDSNFFLLNATAPIDKLKEITTIVFGTDSTVSASWNIWEQLRLARKTGLLTDDELFKSLTSAPAKLRSLNKLGILKEKANADIVIAEKKTANTMNSFFELNPEDMLMIIKNGNIILFDESLRQQFSSYKINVKDFCKICLNERVKYIKGDLKNLMMQIKNYSKNIFFPVETV